MASAKASMSVASSIDVDREELLAALQREHGHPSGSVHGGPVRAEAKAA